MPWNIILGVAYLGGLVVVIIQSFRQKVTPVPQTELDLSQYFADLAKQRAAETEALQQSINERLTFGLKTIGDRVDSLHRGVGELQSIAGSVGDLKKILGGAKTRGIWGEVQLEALLEQMLHPEQYEKNVVTKPGSKDRVEFAVKLPSSDGVTLLPIDAKFPQEAYLRLIEDPNNATLNREFENSIKLNAKTITSKYLNPPVTTDFTIMFVPSEAVFAEVVRRPELMQWLQEARVLLMGPTTCGALLNSLQIGFRTLAVQARAGEVWEALAVVRTEAGKYSEVVEKLTKKFIEAGALVEDLATRQRVLDRKLKGLELPESVRLPAA